ncbi:response regulator [Phormidesmis priestleyi ULC007]|uniref:Response regulator n=1 Tax=Phormidesmis priestleyi ULC007 TaxID=1920490 RepID=A0A2T1DAT3_9CYAN|nr:response regulator [Phormidesmis priestleyi]PSB17608.1 response regulator [Phormidesmis priestleyi ULC007]PZO48485.1 MAG: response regulator [Phormidesmis priestleyi]
MKKILVIEDEQTVRESILDLLEAEGFSGLGGENGNVGLQLARDNHPDLILCDVQMPDLDGYSVLTHLRQVADTADIPFIFLTARGTKADVRYGMELGADDYLTKPCTATELLGAISGRLEKQAALLERYNKQTARTQTEDIARSAPRNVHASRPESSQQPDLEATHASNTRDGLLNHFYQELRNPLSNINMTLHLLKTASIATSFETSVATIQQEYGRELAILQQVYKLQNFLMPESAALLQNCHLIELLESDLDEPDSNN